MSAGDTGAIRKSEEGIGESLRPSETQRATFAMG